MSSKFSGQLSGPVTLSLIRQWQNCVKQKWTYIGIYTFLKMLYNGTTQVLSGKGNVYLSIYYESAIYVVIISKNKKSAMSYFYLEKYSTGQIVHHLKIR